MSSSDTLDELVPCLRRLEHLIKCTDLTGKKTRSTVLDPFDSLLKVIDSNKTARGEHAEVRPVKSMTIFIRVILGATVADIIV